MQSIEHGFQVAGNIHAGDVWREALAASLEIRDKAQAKARLHRS